MKMMIVIDMNATSKKVVYHATIKKNDDIMFNVEDFFEQAGIEVNYEYIDIITGELMFGQTFNYHNFHFEMIEL